MGAEGEVETDPACIEKGKLKQVKKDEAIENKQ